MAGVSMFPDGRAAKVFVLGSKPRGYAQRLDGGVGKVFEEMLGMRCKLVEGGGGMLGTTL